jgi:hypothetical protein
MLIEHEGKRPHADITARVARSPGHPVNVGDAVLVGPHASIVGCAIGDPGHIKSIPNSADQPAVNLTVQ